MGLSFSCRWMVGLAGLSAVLSGMMLAAQDKPQGVADGVPTLHVYTNLVQVPTLVLTPTEDSVGKPIAEGRFSVSIDSGRWFRATHVRQEGDDPISLAILLEVSGDARALMPKMGEALGRLAPLSLSSKDRVSIYPLDCLFLRSMNDMPAESASIRKAVEGGLEEAAPRKADKRDTGCGVKVHLWDSLAHVAVDLSSLPGRRVILVVSDGNGEGSKHTWTEVKDYVQNEGIAVFGLSYVPLAMASLSPMSRGNRGPSAVMTGGASSMNSELISLCQLSGGIGMKVSDPGELRRSLERFVKLVRERYIVEFPRPARSTPGEHGMEVKIEKGAYAIHPSGVSMPVPDPAVAADPSTIQTGPLLTPEEGKHKGMKPQ